MSAPTASTSSIGDAAAKKPVVILTIGMAGSGKTTFVHRMSSYLNSLDPPAPPYLLNLDPAVQNSPFDADIDIRDTIKYKEVMKQYNLGPNGGILTALNLFTTKFDEVLGLVEERAHTLDHVILDTPGQIEIFTWSASGAIITDAVASAFPTVVAYVIDTPCASAPATFMSNMLYACSILYKTRLPFILVFNKTDAQPHAFALEWMRDFEAFQAALASHADSRGADGEPTYMNGLMNSMSLVLDEFYKHLNAVGVSSLTGDGMKEFFDAVEVSREEYEKEYLPELKHNKAEKDAAAKEDSMQRMMADLEIDRKRNQAAFATDRCGQEVEDDADNEDGDTERNDLIDLGKECGPDASKRIDLTRVRPACYTDRLNVLWKRPG